MDDGLQNPGVQKRLSLLVVDGATGFGNGRVFPAGPLREPVAAAAARCQAAVLIGPDATGALANLPPALPVHRARLVPGPEAAALAGRRVLGFAGIAMPEKFFATLAETGADGRRAGARSPTTIRYSQAELDDLLAEADAPGRDAGHHRQGCRPPAAGGARTSAGADRQPGLGRSRCARGTCSGP